MGRRCVQRPGHRSEDFSARARAIRPGPVPAAVVSGLAFGFWIAKSAKVSRLITKYQALSPKLLHPKPSNFVVSKPQTLSLRLRKPEPSKLFQPPAPQSLLSILEAYGLGCRFCCGIVDMRELCGVGGKCGQGPASCLGNLNRM